VDTLQKIKDLYKQVQELEERRQATDSKSEDKKLNEIIWTLKADMESLACDLVEKLVPGHIGMTIKVEKKIDIEPYYYDFDSVAYDIAENPDTYTNEKDVLKEMLNRFHNNIDVYDLIESEDIKVKYD
jgi:hypothetical protein